MIFILSLEAFAISFAITCTMKNVNYSGLCSQKAPKDGYKRFS